MQAFPALHTLFALPALPSHVRWYELTTHPMRKNGISKRFAMSITSESESLTSSHSAMLTLPFFTVSLGDAPGYRVGGIGLLFGLLTSVYRITL